jgi:CDP-2,3-bis-(O-geranylgeranyl)-sn-glycerol synthase
MEFQFIISCLYFFLPAYFTNMTPPLVKRVGLFNFLDKPVDFGKKILGQPIFGSHKTWRGFICGILVGILMAKLLFFLHSYFNLSFYQAIGFSNYRGFNSFLFGFLISFGAAFGDLLFAFIKRRLKMEPGKRFLPFDQTNYVIGSFLILNPFLKISILVWTTIFVLTFFLHIIFNRLGYLLGLHKSKW